jgi:hypothetical protein
MPLDFCSEMQSRTKSNSMLIGIRLKRQWLPELKATQKQSEATLGPAPLGSAPVKILTNPFAALAHSAQL